MTDNSYKYPDKITIYTPMPSTLPRGKHGAGPFALGALSKHYRVRVSQVDHELILKVAADLGIKPAAFVRWCAVYAAKELSKNKQE